MGAVRRSRGVYLVATTAWHRGGVTYDAHGGRSGPILLTQGLSAELRRVGPFLCVGLVGFAVDAGLFSVVHGTGLSRAVARAVSLALATAVTFALNRNFTFAASGRGTPGALSATSLPTSSDGRFIGPEPSGRVRGSLAGSGEFVRYGIVTLLVQGFSYGLFLVLATRLPNLVALFVGAAAATVFSFAGQRLFTFRGTAPVVPAATGPVQANETVLVPGLVRRRRARRRTSQP